MQAQPYVFFEGRCDEAIEFYRKVLGAEVRMVMRYKEGPDPSAYKASMADKVMHANLRIGDSTVLVSDGRCSGRPSFRGFALSLTVAGEAEAEQVFNALADHGKIQSPLAKTFFSPRFGMVFDRFGVLWIIYVGQ